LLSIMFWQVNRVFLNLTDALVYQYFITIVVASYSCVDHK